LYIGNGKDKKNMSNKIKISDLKEGMKFDKPVYIDGNNLLVPPNIPIKQKDIDRLVRWEIDEVETEGNIINEISPPIDFSDIEIQINNSVLNLDGKQSEWVHQITDVFENIRKKRVSMSETNHQMIESITKELIDEIDEHPQVVINNIIHTKKNTVMLPLSALNCASIAAIIAKNNKIPQFRIMQIITASLLHDTGMLRMPEEIINKEGKLTPDELNKIRRHPFHSYQIVMQELKYHEDIGIMVLYHHEKWDGNGYPKSIKGDTIPLGARIIAVADAYEAMLNRRPYRDALIGYNAMKNILSDNGTHFDPDILKSFLQCFGIYPIGSYVLLNNSMVGLVIGVNSNAPMRPRLKLLYDHNGNKVTESNDVDLLENEKLFIVKAINPKEIGKNR
jgi:HD-GYP domain-containing protein (c-di-GMP phosphodiesterase class II)